MTIRNLLGVLALPLTVLSCSLDVPNDVGNIVIYLSVDKETVHLDETVTVTATVKNVGYDGVTLTGPSDCLVYIQIRDSNGVTMYDAGKGCVGQSVTEALAGGEEQSRSFVWNATTPTGVRAPLGFYTIRAFARLAGSLYLSPSSIYIAVE